MKPSDEDVDQVAAKDARIEELESALLGCKLLEIDRAIIAAKE